jgi:peroxiredoxin family protein
MPAPEKLSLVVFSGEAAKVHYAWMMAASSLAIGKGATLFFTGEAIRKPAFSLARNSWSARPG